MKQQGHFARANHTQESMQIRSLIIDLNRIVNTLDVDIAAEEQTTGVTDLMRPEYPTLARSLRARRHNLTETIAALQRLQI
jgi:septation ring formation regulator EzrA